MLTTLLVPYVLFGTCVQIDGGYNCQCQTFTDYVPAGSVMCRKPHWRGKVVQGYTQCMHSLIDLGN